MTGSSDTPASATPPPGVPVLVVGRAQRLAESMPGSPPSISADGRYVAFVSESGDLVAGDHNGMADVFVRDTVENTTVLVSRSRFGGSGAGCSLQPSISAGGQVVAFTSSAPDLVSGDTNRTLDVYLHDRVTRVTTLISTASDGTVGDAASGQPLLSADGQRVAFTSAATNLDPDDLNGVADVYLRDVASGTTELVSRGLDGHAAGGLSSQPAISADGETVTFTSSAPDLAPNDTNDVDDVFVRQVDGGQTRLASAARDGAAGAGPSHTPSISADGRRVAFLSAAGDLTAGSSVNSPDLHGSDGVSATGPHAHDRAYLRDLDGAGTALIGYATGRVAADGEATGAVIAGSGDQVAFTDTSTDLAGQDGAGAAEHLYVAPVRTRSIPAPGQPATTRHPQSEEPGASQGSA